MSKKPDIRPSQEDLLGYLLGALDAPEQARVGIYVEGHPEIQVEIERLRGFLRPLSAMDMPTEPPRGLARRTCSHIFANAEHWVEPRRDALANESLASDGWQIWDLTMLMSVVVLMAMLIMPAVYQSRESARRLACASNLRNLSVALRHHSELNGGRFPLVQTSGPAAVAGSFSLPLKNAGMLAFDHLLLCPATEASAFDNPFSIPALDHLASLSGEPLRCAQRQLGGSYGWHIGQKINGVLTAAEDNGSDDFVIMSDAPEHGRGLGLVACHPGNGRNVLYESGRVCFVMPICELTQGMDDLFHNRLGVLQPGTDEFDSVVVESGVLIDMIMRPEFGTH
jgi:hypothetical protein